jgi:acetamidase/formamidase
MLGRDPAHLHRVFDHSLPPIHTVRPGEEVEFECPRCALPRGATAADFHLLNDRYPHTIVGPVRVEGAEPGDALVVEMLALEPAEDFGQCMVIPGFGLLAEEFPDPYVHHFPIGDGTATLQPGIEIPVRPFCGILGVAPAAPGPHLTTPPRRTGGNMDVARLRAGATLWLPVEAEGALFSCGDGHAAQGAGEVCGTAIETTLRVRLRFDLQKGANLPEPQFTTAGGEGAPSGPAFVTTACGPDLLECCRGAVRHLIDHLGRAHGLSRVEAYVLCSVAADLRVEEVVDRPNWLVSASLPFGIFT